jgi:class 3 adenylate cyclase/predicted ATPase
MKCPECKFEIPDNARFCAGCGIEVGGKCPACQSTLLPKARFCHNCGANRNSTPESAAETIAQPENEKPATPERRQLTVMFCDLVGSTALSEQLDPEELRELINAYQEACSVVVENYGGYISRLMGDGILILFGYPQAHEDDAVRGIHAGLGILEAVSNLDQNFPKKTEFNLQVRIGIATGHVVAGDLVGKGAAEENVIYGDTPNLAARLQGHARPNEMLVSKTTRKLARDHFEFRNLGKNEFKGISEPVEVFRVIGVAEAEGRDEARGLHRSSHLVGREAELELLLKCWEKTKHGDSQIVLLTAEAGIGKSRLVREFKQRTTNESIRRMFMYCSPYHNNSAFYPLIEEIKRAALIEKRDTDEQRLAKLEHALNLQGLDLERVFPLIASLLSLPETERFPLPQLASIEKKRQTLDAVVSSVDALCELQPVLMIIEDAHWIDPSTLELVNQLIERMENRRFLMILTYRIEFQAPWSSLSNVMMLRLNRMNRQQSVEIIMEQTGNKPLPDNVLESILQKSDGVPIYIEEFTKTLLESGQLTEEIDRYTLKGELSPLAIPDTLQDSLAARLDRLETKELAQLAASISRVFSNDLLQQVCQLEDMDMRSALDELVHSEVLIRRGIDPEVYFEFKHALLQDAAYQSLLKSERQRHHKNIAAVIEKNFPDIVNMNPEVLAHHLTECGNRSKAIDYWLRAGKNATKQSANVEAITHFHHGIELIAQLPQDEARDRRELELYLALGPALMATRGFAVSEVENAYVRGLELASQVGTNEQLYSVTWGAWLYRQQRGQMGMATDLAGNLLTLSNSHEDRGIRLQAHHATWTTAYRLAEYSKCCEHAEQGIALYDPEEHMDMAFVYGGHDAGVCGLQHAATTRWLLGYPDRAIAHKDRLLSHAEKINHPFSSALALNFASIQCSLLGEFESADRHSKEVLRTCDEYGVAPQYRNSGSVLSGWAQTMKGHVDEGLQLMRQGLEAHRNAPARAHEAFLISLLADTCIHQGLYDEAGELITEGFELIEKTGERTWMVYLTHLGAELSLIADSDYDQAEAKFLHSIELCREHQARSFELRSATSLAAHWFQQEQRERALDLLLPLYESFSEGRDTADLKKSAALIEKMR